MFRIKIVIKELITECHYDFPMTLKLKKNHWHYILIQDIDKGIIDFCHTFELDERG